MRGQIEIATPQFTRNWELDFNFIPTTDAEFIEVVTTAPKDILKGMGFGYWDTVNSIAEENTEKPKHNIISIPAFNIDGTEAEDFKFDVGRKHAPITQKPIDEEILLIPGEWYNCIPENYPLTSINGEMHLFKKGKTDDDIRFGCLAYGIRIPIESSDSLKGVKK